MFTISAFADEISPEPQEQIDVTGIRMALLEIAQAQRTYVTAHGAYGTLEQLRAEGYIDSVTRGSTRVSAQLPDRLVRADPPASAKRASARHAEPSGRGAAINAAWPVFAIVSDRPARAFRTSVPAGP